MTDARHHPECWSLRDRECGPCTCPTTGGVRHAPQPDARREPVTRWEVQVYQDGTSVDIESPTGQWVRYEDYDTLADRLAASEAQVKELEHEANQEGQQFRQFAQEIITPDMHVAIEGPISFGKLKEVVEAAIAIPTRELAKLKQRLAEVERERDQQGRYACDMLTECKRAQLAEQQALKQLTAREQEAGRLKAVTEIVTTIDESGYATGHDINLLKRALTGEDLKA